MLSKAQAATPARPLRVCFVSSQVYGLLRPSSGLPVGGAEVQIASLAKELAGDPDFEVVILTGDGARAGREREGRATLVLHPFCAVHPVRAASRPEPEAPAQGTGQPAPAWARPGYWLLNRCPAVLAAALRSGVRGAYACRRWLLSVPVVRRILQTARHVQVVMRWTLLFRTIQADVYVTRCAGGQAGYMRLASSLLRRPFVYMVAHDMDVSGEYVRANPVAGRLFEKGLRGADTVICQHQGQAEMVRSRYHRPAHVMRSLCPSPVQVKAAEAKKTILWIARTDAWKQPEIFLDLVGRFPEESFVMVASSSQMDPDNLAGIARAARSLPNLRLLEMIPFEETAALFAAAKIFVNTSKWEGFPNTFLQAAACGTPIVSWAVNPDGILERHQIGFCAGGDRARFEGSIRLLCADDALRADMGRNGRRYVQDHHDPGRIAAQFKALCRAL